MQKHTQEKLLYDLMRNLTIFPVEKIIIPVYLLFCFIALLNCNSMYLLLLKRISQHQSNSLKNKIMLKSNEFVKWSVNNFKFVVQLFFCGAFYVAVFLQIFCYNNGIIWNFVWERNKAQCRI
jgi:hypothetical protein